MLEHDDLHQLICKEPLQLRGERGTADEAGKEEEQERKKKQKEAG